LLYRRQWHSLVRLAVLLVDDLAEAEDVVQDAFVALQRNIKRVRQPGAAAAYLRTSVVNGSRSRLRHRKIMRRHLSVAGPLVSGETAAADHGLVVASEHAAVVDALRALPRRQREVLVLRFWAGLSEREIATTLGVSMGTVKSSASRGLRVLETKMGGTL
jgi:RNA polymerase sigma-70 factor (sigma-E family)